MNAFFSDYLLSQLRRRRRRQRRRQKPQQRQQNQVKTYIHIFHVKRSKSVCDLSHTAYHARFQIAWIIGTGRLLLLWLWRRHHYSRWRLGFLLITPSSTQLPHDGLFKTWVCVVLMSIPPTPTTSYLPRPQLLSFQSLFRCTHRSYWLRRLVLWKCQFLG